jgi:hypothetical protein
MLRHRGYVPLGKTPGYSHTLKDIAMIGRLLNKPIFTLVFTLLFSSGLFAQFPGSPTSFQREEVSDQKVQLALLLDASGSMKRYLDQAKGELWYTVNEVLSAYEGYATPRLEIAILAYGFRKAGSRNDYIHTVVPFTTDLDWAANELYKIKPGGAIERPMKAVNQAVEELNWSYKPGDLKFVFIAGNEKFTTHNLFLNRMNRLKAADISLNTIFAGDYFKGVKKLWKAAAVYGNGEYFALNQPRQERWNHQPGYDRDYIARLNRRLYDTYIPYGSYGNSYWDRYCYLDDYAWDYGYDAYYWRIYYKTQVNYYNPQWDLVDAIYCGYTSWDDIDENDLPRIIRDLDPDERDDYIEALWKRRQNVLEDIKTYGATQAPSSNITGSGHGSGGTVGSMHQAIDKVVRKKVKSSSAVLLKPADFNAPKTPIDGRPGADREVIKRKPTPSNTGGVSIEDQTTHLRKQTPVAPSAPNRRVVNISDKPVQQSAPPKTSPVKPRETREVSKAPVFKSTSTQPQSKSQVGRVQVDKALELEKQKAEKARQAAVAAEVAEVERQRQIAVERETAAREVKIREEKARQERIEAQREAEVERQRQVAVEREAKAREIKIREEKARQERIEAQREAERARQEQIAREREDRAREERMREERARQERMEAQREAERARQEQAARERADRQQAQQRAAQQARQEQASRQAREAASRQEAQRKSQVSKPSSSRSVNKGNIKPGRIK